MQNERMLTDAIRLGTGQDARRAWLCTALDIIQKGACQDGYRPWQGGLLLVAVLRDADYEAGAAEAEGFLVEDFSVAFFDDVAADCKSEACSS